MAGEFELKREPNRRRVRKLLRGFDRAVARAEGYLDTEYGPALARTLISDARQEFARLIPKLPDVKARQPFAQFIAATGWFLAFYRVLARSGGNVANAGEFAYELTAQNLASLPWGITPLIQGLWFSKLLKNRVRTGAKRSLERRGTGAYVYEYVAGDGQQFDFGVDYIECAAWTFLKSQGAPELAPYVCALDQLSSDAFGWGLVRTTTLAEGGSRCDFRFKREGLTRIASTVRPLAADSEIQPTEKNHNNACS